MIQTRHYATLVEYVEFHHTVNPPLSSRQSRNTTPHQRIPALRVRRQRVKDRLLERLGLSRRSPAADDLSVLPDEELLKVPLDPLDAKQTGLLLGEPLEERVGAFAVDVDLLHDGEGHAVVDLAEVLDVVVGAGLLAAELVAGEAEDLEVRVLGGDVLVELLEALVLRGEAALGRRVDDEDDAVLVVGEGDLLARFWGVLD